MAAKKKPQLNLIAENRRAKFKFEILETVEAGLALRGTEVKSLREGQCSLEESFGRIDGAQAFLVSAYIPEYSHGNVQNHEPTRKRKLLLHKREISKLSDRVKTRGLTLVPLKLYWSDRGHAKLLLGVCKGRKVADKREKLRSKDARREAQTG